MIVRREVFFDWYFCFFCGCDICFLENTYNMYIVFEVCFFLIFLVVFIKKREIKEGKGGLMVDRWVYGLLLNMLLEFY